MCDVAIAKDRDPAAAVSEAMRLLGGMGAFIKPSDQVLIKPNFLISEARPGATTTGAVIRAVAQLVLEVGGKPVIAEAGSAQKGLDAFRNAGVFDFAAQNGVPMKNLNEDDMVETEIPGAAVLPKVKVARTALEVDKLITVPVLKTHDQCWVSLGIKNIKGILPTEEKRHSHKLGVERAIVDLNRRFPPALVVIDGTYGMEGLGPMHGDAVPMGLIIGGGNALATDGVATRVIGLEPKQIKHLRYAAEAGLGPKNFDEVRVLGNSIDSVQRTFKTAQQAVEEQYAEMGIRVVSKNVCSGCWAEFRDIYYTLGEERTKLRGYTFVLGEVHTAPAARRITTRSLRRCAS